mmetsp:Transcript_46424/g.83834  ORF Transcript_46424/g.83834 Transcript_46424/m.83834 type:complete len:169 (-) Transcript_46424:26-532(-)
MISTQDLLQSLAYCSNTWGEEGSPLNMWLYVDFLSEMGDNKRDLPFAIQDEDDFMQLCNDNEKLLLWTSTYCDSKHVPLTCDNLLACFDLWFDRNGPHQEHPESFVKEISKVADTFDKHCFSPSLLQAWGEPRTSVNGDCFFLIFCVGRLKCQPQALLLASIAVINEF